MEIPRPVVHERHPPVEMEDVILAHGAQKKPSQPQDTDRQHTLSQSKIHIAGKSQPARSPDHDIAVDTQGPLGP